VRQENACVQCCYIGAESLEDESDTALLMKHIVVIPIGIQGLVVE
jgi:hypothetical protein